MKIIPVACRADNWMYALIDEETKEAAAVDSYDVDKLVKAAESEGVTLGAHNLCTHHHQDHSGGNNDFKKRFPDTVIYGGSDQVEGLTRKVKHGDGFTIGKNIQVSCYATPCHTQDSICYYVEDRVKNQRAVFTGDTLFVSGCGRFFEGTPQEMDKALNTTLASLPDDTVCYVGHEYTKANVAFAASVDPDNEAIKQIKAFCDSNDMTTGKFTIGDEKKHNVFMRLDSDAVKKHTGATSATEAMAKLREMKNSFKG